ncbi:MAG: hypothetical protein IJ666_06750 [Ruminococcus sp.]|nr:hypothetical protein [Ruminococcus sp.]
MAFDDEIIKNAVRMKKCKKVWGAVFSSYLTGGILLILYSFLSITGASWDWLFAKLGTDTLSPIAMMMILDSIIICPAAFFLALRGSYGHNDLCSMLAPALLIANYVFMVILKIRRVFDVNPVPFILCTVYSAVCITASILNIRANIIYHKLEQARGFPHFSERFVEREDERNIRERMKEYRNTHKSDKKIISDMDDVAIPQNTLEKYEQVHKPGTMDDI